MDNKMPDTNVLVKNGINEYAESNLYGFSKGPRGKSLQKRKTWSLNLGSLLWSLLLVFVIAFAGLVGAGLDSLFGMSDDNVIMIIFIFVAAIFQMTFGLSLFANRCQRLAEKLLGVSSGRISQKVFPMYRVASLVHAQSGEIWVYLQKHTADQYSTGMQRVDAWRFAEEDEFEAIEFIAEIGIRASDANQTLHQNLIGETSERQSLAERIAHATSIAQ